jgi:ABC-type multidrug transport system ATPase subunit
MGSSEATAIADSSAPADRASRPPDAPVLEARRLSKQWRSSKLQVLDGVDLDLMPGTATWVGGENGAGKTTLLRIISGLITADSGDVRLFGLDIERDRRAYQQYIGFLSAGNTGLFNRLSVRRHFDYWARLAFVPRTERKAAIEESLDRFNLRELADRRVERMSMGQRQRVRLAMIFLHRPKMLLLDEALTSLDGQGAALLHAACTDVLEHGGAILACSPTGERDDEIDFSRRFLLDDGHLRLIG